MLCRLRHRTGLEKTAEAVEPAEHDVEGAVAVTTDASNFRVISDLEWAPLGTRGGFGVPISDARYPRVDRESPAIKR